MVVLKIKSLSVKLMNIPSPSASVSLVWRLYAWVTVSTSTGTVKCITHWMTHQLRLEPLHSTKSWGRSNTSSQTKQELSPRTSCVSTSAPSMANPMVCLSYSLGFLHCVPLHPQRLNLISKRECHVRSCSDQVEGYPSGMSGQPNCITSHVLIVSPFFSLFYLPFSAPLLP